ncbi:protein of unknown function [Streptomyces sp. KY75]|nr:protein of unknown function [Streptomyces sp. KY70]CAD5982613.1 protein of unknown function [Streptomyces sp. KY75]
MLGQVIRNLPETNRVSRSPLPNPCCPPGSSEPGTHTHNRGESVRTLAQRTVGQPSVPSEPDS